MNINQLIDTFVEKVNASSREPGFEDEIPQSVRTGIRNDIGMFDWKIKSYQNVNWLVELESKLPKPYPDSFKSLISRYIFPRFEITPLLFLANTPEGLALKLHELKYGIFIDKPLSKCLFENGFIQFARTDTGDYDPICFDTNHKIKSKEYPIVQIDHEGILVKSKIIIVNNIASSFIEFIQNFLDNN